MNEVGLAEALFDNDSEWPDELAFRQGEILRILDQRPADGMADGWWLCSDQTGNQGIAPANRLRLIHRFDEIPQNRVITPRRFGDVFLYNDSLFPEDDELFGTRFNLTSGYDSPLALNRIRLLHDSGHPFELTDRNGAEPGRVPVVHQVPIRVQSHATTNGDQNGTNSGSKRRKSPPPPPQRRYFHNFSDGSSSEQEKLPPAEKRTASSSTTISINGGLYDNPRANVQWRRDMQGGDMVAASSVPAPPFQDRVSGASTVSLTPPDGNSERSSSVSESSRSSLQDTYDIPSSLSRPSAAVGVSAQRTESNSTTPTPSGYPSGERSVIMNVLEDSMYDSPRSSVSLRQKPKSTAPISEGNGNDLASQAMQLKSRLDAVRHHEMLLREPTYDVPKPAVIVEQLPSDLERLSVSSMDSKDSDYQELLAGKEELRLSPQKAMHRLVARQRELESAVSRLAGFSMDKNWRRRHVLQDSISDIRLSVNQVCRCLESFLDLCGGSLANLSKTGALQGLPDTDRRQMAKKLTHLLRPTKDSQKLLERLRQTLGRMGWTLAGLTRDPSTNKGSDALDRFIEVAKQLPDDCRQVAAFIQGNASVIFREEDPTERSTTVSELESSGGGSSSADRSQQVLLNGYPEESRVLEEDDLESSASDVEHHDESLFDDYDFIDTARSREANGRSGDSGAATPTPDLRNGNANRLTNGHSEKQISPEDKQILAFYVPQVDQHMEFLSGAIEGFLSTVEENQPPRVFVGKSKLVILAAHKLVYIGDSVAQCLQSAGPAEQTKRASDKLCQVLKDCVSTTKSASNHFPGVTYMQKMVNSMVSVSHVAHDLKLLLKEMGGDEEK